jgi:hypothetical protein
VPRFPVVLVRAVAPLTIVGGVLLVLHTYVFRGMANSLVGDPLGFFLPKHCYLGRSLAAGNIPLWNPHVMGGVPFAADPQSGWLYAPAMLLYSVLPCPTAFGWYVAIHPILAGLGLFWFLSSEGASRSAAMVGALALALPLAGSSIGAGSLPFSGALAWTSVMLALAAKYRRARSSEALLWVTMLALAWGQLAGAHISTGLLLGTLCTGLYLLFGLVTDVRSAVLTRRRALSKVAVLLPAILIINAAVLLPRLLYLPRTTLGLGYLQLSELSREIAGVAWPAGTFSRGLPSAWPLMLARAPGYYLGGALVLVCFAWLGKAARRRAMPFTLFGLFCFIASLRPVASLLRPLRDSLVGAIYLHAPGRLFYGVLVALAVLAAIGFEGWTGSEQRGHRTLVLLPVAFWSSMPFFSSRGAAQIVSIVGIGVLTPIFFITAGRPQRGWILTTALGVEFLLAGLWGHGAFAHPVAQGTWIAGRPPFEAPHLPKPSLENFLLPRPPDIRVRSFATPGPIARTLITEGSGRYISLNPKRTFPSGYLAQRRHWWGLLASQQSMLFGLEEAQGYDPVQLRRYWQFLRAIDPKPIQYNRAWFLSPDRAAFDVLQIQWVVAPDPTALPDGTNGSAAQQGVWTLFRLASVTPRVSVVGDWVVVPSSVAALKHVVGSRIASTQVVLEHQPSFPLVPAEQSGSASYRWLDSDTALVQVDVRAPAIVLVRNTWDSNWTARVDGEPESVFPANYVVQGIEVSQGRHSILLEYQDPSVGVGLFLSVVSLTGFALGVLFLRVRARTGFLSSAEVKRGA